MLPCMNVFRLFNAEFIIRAIEFYFLGKFEIFFMNMKENFYEDDLNLNDSFYCVKCDNRTSFNGNILIIFNAEDFIRK